MASPTRVTSPTSALYPKSPERVNRLPQQPLSPVLQLMDPFLDRTPTRGVLDKVVQFNNLSKEATQKKKDHEAALRRAVLGREEAETETKKLKDENKALKEKLEEAKGRDQRTAKKFEAFGEEKRKLIDHQHKCQKISENEVRRARKEAFKFSSALVTAQEDLQKARGHMEELREQANIERHRGKKYQQEAFDSQLAVAGLEEEVQSLKRKLSVMEGERDALRTNLDEEHVARIALEGRLPLPPAADPEDEFASPRKSKARRISARRESLKENMDPSWQHSNDIFDIMWAAEEGDEFAIAKRNLWVEEKRRQEAEMMITYLKAEYENKHCTCDKVLPEAHKCVEQGEAKYVEKAVAPESSIPKTPTDMQIKHDEANVVEDTIVHHTPSHQEVEQTMDADLESASMKSVQSEPAPWAIHEDEPEQEPSMTAERTIDAEPFHRVDLAPIEPSISPSLIDLEADKENSSHPPEASFLSIKSEDIESSMSYSITPVPAPQVIDEPVKLHAPRQPPPVYKHQTTTISIPLKTGESPVKKHDYPFSPGATMTREQALQAIKQRRGRARSAHGGMRTPFKPDVRNISSKSAPAL